MLLSSNDTADNHCEEKAFGCLQLKWCLTERCLGQRQQPVPLRSSSLAEMRPRWPRNDTENAAGHSSSGGAAAASTSSFDTGPRRCCSLERFERGDLVSAISDNGISAGLLATLLLELLLLEFLFVQSETEQCVKFCIYI